MKHYISVLLSFITINLSAQIYIGQPIKEVLNILEYQCKPKDCKIEKKYYDGQLDQIIVYKYDQLYYELALRTDAIDYYFTENGKYILKETKLPEISYLQLNKLFDKLYGTTKIDDYYFTEDFNHYQFISAEKGTATITYAKTNMNSLSKPMKETIEKRKTEWSKKVNKEEKVINAVRNEYVNIDNYQKDFSEQLTTKLISSIKKGTYRDGESLKVYHQTAKGAFQMRLYANRNREYATKEITKLNPIDYNVYRLFENQLFKLPQITDTLNGKTYNRHREIYLNFNCDMIIGTISVRKKGKKVQFENTNLTEDQKNQIIEYLISEKKGGYIISYQFGTINEIDITNINAFKMP